MKNYMDKIDIDSTIWTEIIANENIFDEKIYEILIFLLESDKCEASAGEIAKKLYYNYHVQVNKIISDFSKRIIKHYPNIEIPRRKDGSISYWHIPFLGVEGKNKFTWILRNELKEALIKRYKNELLNIELPENYIEESKFYEGKQKKSLINTYERNPYARIACLEHYGYKCIICGFDFEKIYGEIGKGIIHVHHKNKISEINDQHEIDPINDLVPVCPNCHTVIHSKKEMYTINEMIEIIKEK